MTVTEPRRRTDAEPATERRTAIRTCPLCEAVCGLELTLEGDRVVRVRGDRDDVFSRGYLCPKGTTIGALHDDPDRVRRPLVKRDGAFVEVSWAEAWRAVAEGLGGVVERHGREALAYYAGNPNAHNLGALLYGRVLGRGIGSPNVFSASTVDQRPKEISAGLMFGHPLTLPVPDVDRTDLLIVLGANPYASNGSLATAPDWPGRLEALQARGGRLVVIDPRRTRTAEQADEHVAIIPGTDALLLAAMVHVLAADDLVDLGHLADATVGVDEVLAAVAPFSPEAVAEACGIDAATIRRLTHELAAAESAAVYGRIGTCVVEFGTTTSWLVDVVNALSGNLDRPGGAMFTTAAVGAANTRGAPRVGRGIRLHRRHSRVRGLPETLGELPVAVLAEEIDTPGEGQIRALVTAAGNPVLSTPNSARLDAALASLEFMVSVDIYVNETTRHADVILPAPSALQKAHYDIPFFQLALRNVANWSPAVLPLDDDQLDEWEVLVTLGRIAAGDAPDAIDVAAVDDAVAHALAASITGDDTSPLAGRDPSELLDAVAPRRGPARLVDLQLRSGPHGDHFGLRPDGLSLDVLEANPHGVDLGPLEPRLPDALRTPSGMIELAPDILVADLDRLAADLERRRTDPDDRLVLVGRRDLRSNNSWMHNVTVLVKGRPRCTLHVHPDDAERLGLVGGGSARITSRVGEVVAPVEVTDAIRPGVVSLPHGWGHDLPGVRLGVAAEHAGVNSNVLADDEAIDPISGNAVLNGIPVTVASA
ncbi:MAG TPA: molybdopterin-dependent oxidoreductase [Acidimicrobiales bacterium]|nr:molybdopterin-dependent oxidoreductase [Acidimicrobiales bacterium]